MSEGVARQTLSGDFNNRLYVFTCSVHNNLFPFASDLFYI